MSKPNVTKSEKSYNKLIWPLYFVNGFNSIAFGVLDYLKEKFKRWNNLTIFSYSGDLFRDESILVLGATDEEEAKRIIITVFLKILIKERKKQYIPEYKSITQLELYLQAGITKNLKNGYPHDRLFEKEIHDHLKKIIDE